MLSACLPVRAEGPAAAAKTATQRPALLLNIVVDGLESQYLDMLLDAMPPGGLRRLATDGARLNHVDYGTPLDATAATAVLMTGAPPSVSGIGGERRYDTAKYRSVGSLSDPATMGNFTDETYSPAALPVSTLGDEAKIAGGGTSVVYSIAPSASQAILLAGHAANSAVWLGDGNGQWATTTYYKETPTVIANRNRLQPLRQRLDTMAWAPMNATAATTLVPAHLKAYPFRHRFTGPRQWQVTAFKASPLYNEEAVTVALDYIKNLSLGRHDEPDVLSLGLSVKPYLYGKNTDNRYEVADAYMRLDASLARLLQAADRAAGPGRTVVSLAATPPSTLTRKEDDRWGLPHGQFSPQKARSLLNLYLVAKHGNGEWAKAWQDGAFYLNTSLADERQVPVEELRREAAAFLRRMAGVNNALTIDDILDGRGDNGARRRNTPLATAADVYVDIMPGWQIVDVAATDTGAQPVEMVLRAVAPTAPMFIMGPGVRAQTIDTPVDARVIAPTLAGLLKIRPPNASSLPPLSLK